MLCREELGDELHVICLDMELEDQMARLDSLTLESFSFSWMCLEFPRCGPRAPFVKVQYALGKPYPTKMDKFSETFQIREVGALRHFLSDVRQDCHPSW